MNQEELQQLVEQVSRQYFHRDFEHAVKINTRFKTTGGRYHLDDHHLEFNQEFLQAGRETALLGIIKHELTHYHLHLQNRGYKHQDQDFKRLLQQVGGSRFAPNIGNARRLVKKRHYICTNCGQKYNRVKLIDLKRYRCGKCRGVLRKIS